MSGQCLSLFLPLIGTLIGVSVPIVSGFFYYSFQKRQDRLEKLHDEKRQAYRQYIEKLIDLVIDQGTKDKTAGINIKKFQDVMSSTSLLSLYAPEHIVQMAIKGLNSVNGAPDDKDKSHKGILGTLTKAMKDDLEKS